MPGLKGERGPVGPPGAQGDKGAQGDSGAEGTFDPKDHPIYLSSVAPLGAVYLKVGSFIQFYCSNVSSTYNFHLCFFSKNGSWK